MVEREKEKQKGQQQNRKCEKSKQSIEILFTIDKQVVHRQIKKKIDEKTRNIKKYELF